MSVEETEQTLTDPNERIIKQITVDDIQAADLLFDQLMGTGVTARKEYIKDLFEVFHFISKNYVKSTYYSPYKISDDAKFLKNNRIFTAYPTSRLKL